MLLLIIFRLRLLAVKTTIHCRLLSQPADQFYYEMDKKITFGDLGLNKELVQSLADNNLVHPTQIQKIAIPQVLESHNSTITAETGCGKTIAYLAPLLQQISKWKSLTSRGCNHPLALILTPSRELSAQIGVSDYDFNKCTKTN